MRPNPPRPRLAYVLAQLLLLGVVACGPASPSEGPITISPAEITLNPGERRSFRALSRASEPLVWQASGGAVTANGATAVFTAPAHEGRYLLTVRSGSYSASADIRVALPEAFAGNQASVSGSLATANRLIPLRPAREVVAQLGPAWSPQATVGAALAEKSVGVARELLVRYREPARAPALRPLLEAAYGLRLHKPGAPGGADLFALARNHEPRDLPALAAQLERDPRILSAEVNQALKLAALPADPRLLEQWHMAAAGLPVAWAHQRANASARRVAHDSLPAHDAPIVVAVIDSGFDLAHEDLRGRFLPGYDFCADLACDHTDDDPSYGHPGNFHGTHVAGILGATGDNGLGVTGVAHGGEVMLLPVKVFNDRGSGATLSTLIDGLRYAVGLEVVTADGKRVINPHPARVVNLSLGSYDPSSAVQATIDEARARGAVIVAATGNQGMAQIMTPAAAVGVLAVGASTQEFRRACFSNYGSSHRGPGGVDLLAPGGEGKCGAAEGQAVLSTIPGSGYGLAVGTSMAAPMVAGVAALLFSEDPELGVAGVEARLLASAFFDPDYMTPEEYGAGVLRAERALGLPGPGDDVTVIATTPGTPERVLATTVTLDLAGGSSSYALRLPPGDYRLSAGKDAPGWLFASAELRALAAGERREAPVLELAPQP